MVSMGAFLLIFILLAFFFFARTALSATLGMALDSCSLNPVPSSSLVLLEHSLLRKGAHGSRHVIVEVQDSPRAQIALSYSG